MGRLKKEYTWAWLIWGALVAFVDIAGVRWLYPVLIGLFAILEGVAILRRAPGGDTLSEQVWAFYAGKPARIPLVTGLALWFGFRLYEVGTGSLVMLGPVDVARLAFCAGLVGWLIPHFLGRGRFG